MLNCGAISYGQAEASWNIPNAPIPVSPDRIYAIQKALRPGRQVWEAKSYIELQQNNMDTKALCPV
jgi:hypothetical protein